jgi:hypothetical protein
LVSSETFVNSRVFNTASRNLSKDLRFSGGFLRSTILFETPFNLASVIQDGKSEIGVG